MMIFLLITAFSILAVQGQQIFENDLSVSLQPPPLPGVGSTDFFVNSIPPEINTAPPEQLPAVATQQLAHRAVLFNSEQESKLPPNLRNQFYKDPRIAEVLAKQSWFAPGEKHVTDRESEKIPRDRIYYALKSAGLVRRRRSVVFPRF